jgi:ATP-binding cassette subfamily B protein
MIVYAPILGFGAFGKVLKSDTGLSWIIGVCIGALLLLVAILFAAVLPKFAVTQKLVDKLNLVTKEILTGLPVIRAFAREDHEKKRFDTANMDITKVNIFVNRAMSLMMPMMMLIMNGASVLIIWAGGHAVDAGTVQIGNLTAFISYTMQIIMSFLMLTMMSIILPRAIISLRRVAEVLDVTPEIDDPSRPMQFRPDINGKVEFRNVTFRYPGADEDVLKNISFVSEKGKTTAIIGSTGSGKSTLANLIPRFFDVTSGEILVDGIDVRNVTLKDLRDKIGYVPQKAVLLSGTITENIAYAANGGAIITQKTVEKAARISQSEGFVTEHPDGYDREISQGGGNVSGGQKQRLSIARAIAKNPEIYIFDDSFSALDFKTDIKLRRALSEVTQNSAVIIIAQRINTVLKADLIIVLEEGEIAGMGKHGELMKTCGVYRDIAYSQLSAKELGVNEDQTAVLNGGA